MSESSVQGNSWPEQEIVSAWLKKHGFDIPWPAQYELQQELTQWRMVQSSRSSALTARSEGFREGVEASKRLCGAEAEYRRLRHDKPLPGDADPTIQAHKQVTAHKLGQAISALSPRETDAKVGQGWVPIGEAPRQVAWIDNDARYVGIIIGQSRYLLELPPPPERP